MASAFPTYTKTKWSSPSEQSKIIVPCSDSTVPSDWMTDFPSANAWDTTASVSDGDITLTKIFFFRVKDGVTVKPREIPPIEVFRAPGFPKRHSRLPEDTRFVYLGNGELSKLNNDLDSKIWVYRATYVLNASIDDDEDENTKPWNRKPWNVSMSHPEVQKPFLYGFDDENEMFRIIYNENNENVMIPTEPVVNSAGDRFELMMTKTNLQLNFTYAVRPTRFNINDIVARIHSINKSEIKIIGIVIPARKGFIESFEPHYQIDDRGTAYWELNVSILIDVIGDGFQRHVYDVGNRARWHTEGFETDSSGKIQFVDANGVIKTYGNGKLTRAPQAIYGWWPYDSTNGQFKVNKKFQIGNAQMLMAAKEQYDKVLNANKIFGDFVYETLTDIPLAPNGTVWFNALDPESQYYGKYNIKRFQEHPQMDWESLDMPRNGVKW